jgi:tRNA A-37 threonylcarbamoyl transferase component Bud32
MAGASSSQPPPAGVIGGRFVIEDALGRGGMAAVYRVRDAKSGERYALKRVWADDKKRSAKRKALLEREFHTLTHLRHPRIIEVYDFGVDSEGPYYTMELLDGADLDAGGRVQWQEACALLRDIASSLAIVHSRGLIHRDVSARNVRRTADGRAKLIDFGGMVSMGAANDVIGTPPFMAPEVLQMQALDARADLFSLGALGFYLLTGRHAFPARRTQDLRDAWRTRPAAPSRQWPEIPNALSALVLQLLSLDRGGRPQTAAEVMERLCVIAALPKEELPEIVSGYLATPTLVGRQKTLIAIRGRMLSLVRGDGGALLIEGAAGSGRSRMIDACVFEGKLLTTIVTRAGASDATEPWGVAKAIASQLFAQLPTEAYEATRLSIAHLGHLIEELRPDSSDSVPITPPERSLVLRELRDFVLALARKNRLLIAIDDADHIDEPSMAWLAAIADKADRQSVLLAMSMEHEQPGEPTPAGVLRSLSRHEPLPLLAAEQTEALLRSVFGDAKNLGLIAAHIHALSLGNPRATIELAQHLVARGFARYESGSWLLPQQLDASDMPATFSESLMRRLDALGADARELAEALCIGEAQAFPVTTYKALTHHGDQTRVFQALEELVAARILSAGTENYSFSQTGFVSLLLARMPEARKAALHGRFAELLALSGADVVQRAVHLMAAGRESEAVHLLCGIDLQARLPPLALLEAAVTYAERDATLPARATHRLRMALLSKAALTLESPAFERWLPPVIAQLTRDSGLALYAELAHLPDKERLSAALTQQQQRYLATPENEKVYALVDAVRELARLTGSACSIAGSAFDLTILDQLPALEPLLPLSPALRIVMQVKTATRDWLSGRAERACRTFEDILARIAQPDRAGLDDTQSERTQVAVRYVLALHEAVNGIEHAEQHAQFLESRRALRVNAWRVRSLLQLSQGDAEAAAKSARRAELLQLQDNETHYPGTGVGLQMSASFFAADLLGVKRMLDSLEHLSETHRGWRPMFHYGQSCYRYLSGDLEGALERVLAGFELAVPGRNMPWGFLAAQHIKLLRELGRRDEALARAQEYMARAHTDELTMAQRFILMESAVTFATAQQPEQALAIIEPLIQHIESIGARGLALGVFFEARARIAIALRDREGFERAAESCAREYQRGQNAAVSAKFARLMDEARAHDLAPAEAASFEIAMRLQPETVEQDQNNTIVSRILECVDASDRARCALTMLLQSTDSYLGHLYGVQGDRLVALAGLPTIEAEPDLEQWLWRWLSAEREIAAHPATSSEDDDYDTVDTAGGALDGDDYETVDSAGAPADEDGTPTVVGGKPVHGISPEYVDADGKRYHAVMVIQEKSGVRRIAAVLSLHVESGFRRRPPARLLTQVANQLLAHGDVSGAILGEPPNLNAL